MVRRTWMVLIALGVLFLIGGVVAGNVAEVDPNSGPGELNYKAHELIVKFKQVVADRLEGG